MKSLPRQLVLAGLVSSFLVMSTLNKQNIVSAQRHAAVTVTRLYTGPDGQTHAAEIEVILVTAAGLERSDFVKATGLQFACLPSGRALDWHTAPRRQYVITVSGRGEIELTAGQKIPAEPGRVFLAEDVTGKGHISRTVGTQDWITAQIPLDE
jgi:quercetin dioxygenase-like cupin family protein